MASGSKQRRAKWTADIERRLIDIWADIIQEFGGKMITQRKKEAIATTRLNVYVSEELGRTDLYSEKAVYNKIDTVMKKGKGMYVTYQKKGETGREYTEEDAELDIEAAEICWPNFKTLYARFKDHPSLGPGAVEDSLTPSPSTGVASKNVVGDEPEDADIPEVSRPPSTSVADSVSEEDEDDLPVPPSKKKKKGYDTPVARVGRKKGKGTATTQFLLAMSDMQERMQERQMNHDAKMQEDAMKFQLKMEADRVKLEADISARLQQ